MGAHDRRPTTHQYIMQGEQRDVAQALEKELFPGFDDEYIPTNYSMQPVKELGDELHKYPFSTGVSV
jgi:hypothetical protein